MANYSDFSITLTGNPFELRAFYDEFNTLTPWHFNISELCNDCFTHEPPTLHLSGSGHWGIDIDAIVELASIHNLSGEVVDAEPGDDFFIHTELEKGEVTYSCNTGYMSDEHAEWLNDPHYWSEAYEYALDEPEEYPEIIEFLNKHGVKDEQS